MQRLARRERRPTHCGKSSSDPDAGTGAQAGAAGDGAEHSGTSGDADGGSLTQAADGAGGTQAHAGEATGGDGPAARGGAPQGGGGAEGGAGGAPVEPFIATDCHDLPVELDAERLRLCVLLAGCTDESFGLCVTSPSTQQSFLLGHGQDAPSEGTYQLGACGPEVATCSDLEGCAAGVTLPTPTATCSNLSRTFCVGNSRAACTGDGILYQAPDCGLAGDLVCSPNGGLDPAEYYVECVPQGCDAPDFPTDECSGDDYTYYNGHMTVRVHCPAYGFKTCKQGKTPNSGHCSN